MIAVSLQVLLWTLIGVVLIGIASYLGRRSYRKFLRKARGPAAQSLPRGTVQTKLDALLDPLEAQDRKSVV